MSFFMLKHRAIVLHRSNPDKERLPIVSGDVAQLADGRLFARWHTQGEGGLWPICREYEEGEDPLKVPRPMFYDPWGWQRGRFESFRAGWLKWNRNGEPNERQRFADTWPEVAGILGITPNPEHFIVDVNDVYYPRDFEVPRWREFIERHSVGNYGLYGEHPEDPLDHSQEWTITLQAAPIQARHAVDTGRGVIKSRWVLPKSAQGKLPMPEHMTGAAYTVDITTVYCDRGRRTLVEPVFHVGGISDEPKATPAGTPPDQRAGSGRANTDRSAGGRLADE